MKKRSEAFEDAVFAGAFLIMGLAFGVALCKFCPPILHWALRGVA